MSSKTMTRDMTRGNLYKQMVLFALPLFLSQTFQQLYNTADTLVVGAFIGTEALAAVSSSGSLIFLLTSFFDGVALGAGVVISRYFGAHNMEKVDMAVHTTLSLGLVSGALLTVVGVAFTPTFLTWMQTDPEVMPDAVEYFRFYFLGGIALVLYNVCRGIMTAMGDSRRPLRYLIFSSCLNVVLDVVLIAVFGCGVWAAAVATVVSQGASVVLCLVHLFVKQKDVDIRLSKLRFHKNVLAEILKNGIPSGVQNSVIGFANVIVQSQINTFHTVATAAFGTHAKIEGFAFLPITSFSMAISTFISQNLGARQYDRARRGAQFGIVSAVVLAEIIGILYYTFANGMNGIFSQDPDVLDLGLRQARIESLFYFLLAFSHAIAAVCRGAGRSFVPMAVMLSVWCVLRVSYIYLVMFTVGSIDLIYWAYPLTWTISSIIFFVYYKRSDWIHGFDRM